VARHRFLWLVLNHPRWALLVEGASVLHVAPEPQITAVLRAVPGLRYVSTDLQDPAAMVTADLTDLPFGDGDFDLVLCSHVLEHVPNDRRAMLELCRVLRPGGTALIQAPVNYEQPQTFEDAAIHDPGERRRLFSQDDHVRVYGPDLQQRLEDAGFAVKILTPADLGLSESRHGLCPQWGPLRNDLYLCTPAG
jgi:SAM-dependent methyltransferase